MSYLGRFAAYPPPGVGPWNPYYWPSNGLNPWTGGWYGSPAASASPCMTVQNTVTPCFTTHGALGACVPVQDLPSYNGLYVGVCLPQSAGLPRK